MTIYLVCKDCKIKFDTLAAAADFGSKHPEINPICIMMDGEEIAIF